MLYLHTRDTKLKSQTHSSCIDHMNKLQIQTHSSCFTCTHELQKERKKACHCNYPPYDSCNDKRQNDQKFLAIQPQQTLRAVFFIYRPIALNHRE